MSIPRLLVSVCNLGEALAAVEGGCDFLDVKEPSRGPLGMADAHIIGRIAAFSASAGAAGAPIPCSAALGELVQRRDIPPRSPLPPEVTYLKLGPAHLETAKRWLDAWRQTRDRFESLSGRPLRWVAVAYADWQSAGAPCPRTILEMAIEERSDGFLIDTYQKDGRSSLDIAGADDLARLSAESRQARLIVALAGSLRLEHLPILADVCPDVIAVRGAACEGGNRSAAISPALVRRLRLALTELFGDCPAIR